MEPLLRNATPAAVEILCLSSDSPPDAVDTRLRVGAGAGGGGGPAAGSIGVQFVGASVAATRIEVAVLFERGNPLVEEDGERVRCGESGEGPELVAIAAADDSSSARDVGRMQLCDAGVSRSQAGWTAETAPEDADGECGAQVCVGVVLATAEALELFAIDVLLSRLPDVLAHAVVDVADTDIASGTDAGAKFARTLESPVEAAFEFGFGIGWRADDGAGVGSALALRTRFDLEPRSDAGGEGIEMEPLFELIDLALSSVGPASSPFEFELRSFDLRAAALRTVHGVFGSENGVHTCVLPLWACSSSIAGTGGGIPELLLTESGRFSGAGLTCVGGGTSRVGNGGGGVLAAGATAPDAPSDVLLWAAGGAGGSRNVCTPIERHAVRGRARLARSSLAPPAPASASRSASVTRVGVCCTPTSTVERPEERWRASSGSLRACIAAYANDEEYAGRSRSRSR